ncbi:MAG: hypothetical protein RLZZ338_1369 [Cyanobacteriota bacterium]|jgi:hypothetical protein
MTDTNEQFLNPDDVLTASCSSIMFQNTFRVSEFVDMIQTKLLPEEKLFGNGLECELLRPGDFWTKGKVKLRLEFEHDDSETSNTPALPMAFNPSLPSGEKGAIAVNYGIQTQPAVATPTAKVPNDPRIRSNQQGALGMWS